MRIWKIAAPALIAAAALMAVPAEKRVNELSGAEMYRTFCASCHGIDGKGAGPVAAALNRALPDLTRIARRNKGEFPSARIRHIIDGYEIESVHGTREMPVWGDYFRDNTGRDEALIALRETNLTEYIRSIQEK